MLTLQEAEVIAKRLYKTRQKLQETQDLFQEEIADVQKEMDAIYHQLEAAKRPLQDEIVYLESQLTAFHAEHLAATGEKTVRLPHATLSSRKQPQKFNYDNEQLKAWAKVNAPDAVITSETLAWGDLKKELDVIDGKAVYKPTGEVVELIEALPQETAYSVKVVE